jgi:hypothetical protein
MEGTGYSDVGQACDLAGFPFVLMEMLGTLGSLAPSGQKNRYTQPKCPRHFEDWNESFFTLVSSTTTFCISGKLQWA